MYSFKYWRAYCYCVVVHGVNSETNNIKEFASHLTLDTYVHTGGTTLGR